MKKSLIVSSLCLSVMLAGCIVNVAEQNTERWAYASGKGVLSVYFDASLYRDAFSVQGSAADTLIADGTFSLWSPGSSTASSIAQNVNLFWSIDTLHKGQLFANSQGPQKELLSIDKIGVTIPRRVGLDVITTSNDVSVQGMTGNINVAGSSSNITCDVAGRITLQTTSGKITGSTGLGGSAQSTSGDITITLSSKNFETILARDSTGNVNVHVPAGVGVTFFLATYGGNITLSYDKVAQSSKSALNVSVNGGGKVINVATATGSITVSN
jgi:hypothetical protein